MGPMHIYFSGSISGGRHDVDLYAKLVDALRAAGHDVFSGAVADGTVRGGGERMDDEAIFLRDMEALAQAAEKGGMLIAEVSRPSIGVGYEIAAARYRFDMPVVALFRPAHVERCSAMIAGDPGVRLIRYSENQLDELAHELVEEISCFA